MNILDHNRNVICSDLKKLSNIAIAEKYHVNRATVYKWRKKFTIPRFVGKEECRKRILKLIHDDNMGYRYGVTLREFCYSCESSRQKLYYILKELEREKLIYPVGASSTRRWYLYEE